MPTVHFLGRILPDFLKISIDQDVIVKYEPQETDLIIEFKNNIVNSQIDLECRLNHYSKAVFNQIYTYALDFSRVSVNLVAFANGYGLSVILDSFVDPNGVKSTLIIKDESLSSLCTVYSIKKEFGEIHKMLLSDPNLFLALNDLIECLTLTNVSPVNCARAIERLKHLISPNSSNDNQSWQQMRSVLQIDEAYLKFITDHSINPRHGKPGHISGSVISEITRRAWSIMNRYFEYRKRGSKPLPMNEFTLLKG